MGEYGMFEIMQREERNRERAMQRQKGRFEPRRDVFRLPKKFYLWAKARQKCFLEERKNEKLTRWV